MPKSSLSVTRLAHTAEPSIAAQVLAVMAPRPRKARLTHKNTRVVPENRIFPAGYAEMRNPLAYFGDRNI
jgi:hypothetical protein